MSRVAVQIVLYRNAADLPGLLASLKEQTFPHWKLFVREQSCDAEEQGRARKALTQSGIPHVWQVASENGGFAGGHAALFAEHTEPFLLILNGDVRLDPSYLSVAMACVVADASIGSVAGLIYRSEGEPRSVVDTAGLEYRCLGRITDRWAGFRTDARVLASLSQEKVFGVSGAVALYRRTAVEHAGGLFDPSWFMYKEDVDLAIRLHRAGWVCQFEPRAVAFHRRGMKDEGMGWRARMRAERLRPSALRESSYVNQWRIYRRHARWSLGFADLARSVCAEIARSVLVFASSPRLFFRAWKRILFG